VVSARTLDRFFLVAFMAILPPKRDWFPVC